MQIYRAPPMEETCSLLAAAGLPTEDLSLRDFEDFFGCGNGDRPKGVIGLEVRHPYGLLRSLVVSEEVRGCGCGKALVRRIEAHAKSRNLQGIYLLTETAAEFFQSLGYEPVVRDDVPEAIRETTEFSSLCPDSAIVMRKYIAGEG